jgi:hypothetical protein
MRFRKTLSFLILATALVFALSAWAQQKPFIKDKDDAPLNRDTASALKAAKEYQRTLVKPSSMQVRTAYVTSTGAICLKVGGQDRFGRMVVRRVVCQMQVISRGKQKGETKGKWSSDDTGRMDPWYGVCSQGYFGANMLPGTNVTDKVNHATPEGSSCRSLFLIIRLKLNAATCTISRFCVFRYPKLGREEDSAPLGQSPSAPRLRVEAVE